MKNTKFLIAVVLGLMTSYGQARSVISPFQQDPNVELVSDLSNTLDDRNTEDAFNEYTAKPKFSSWIEIKFEKDPAYVYKLGVKFIEDENNKVQKVTTSRLYKNGFIVDEKQHKDIHNFGFITLDSLYKYVPFNGLNELGILTNAAGFCGGGYGHILFGRSGDKLIDEIQINDYAEGEGIIPGSYISKRFDLDLQKQELIIKTKKAYDFADGNGKEKVYYQISDHFKFKGAKFEMTSQRIPKFKYVIAKNGLSARHDPFLTAPREGVLKYGQMVKVIQVTDLTLSVKEGRDIIDGHWVEIENEGDYLSSPAYVFDGYLSDKKPPKKEKKIIK